MWKRLVFILTIGWTAFQASGQSEANKFGIENDFENDYREEWPAAWITNPDIYLTHIAG